MGTGNRVVIMCTCSAPRGALGLGVGYLLPKVGQATLEAIRVQYRALDDVISWDAPNQKLNVCK